MDAAAFETWDVEETIIAIELSKLRDLLKLAGPDDFVMLVMMHLSDNSTSKSEK